MNVPLPTVARKYPHDHVYVYLFMLQYISWPEFGLSNIHKNIFCTEPLYSTQLEVYNKGINSTSIYFVCSWKYSYKNYWVKTFHYTYWCCDHSYWNNFKDSLNQYSTSFSALKLHLGGPNFHHFRRIFTWLSKFLQPQWATRQGNVTRSS